jgi:hypothetical protein
VVTTLSGDRSLRVLGAARTLAVLHARRQP